MGLERLVTLQPVNQCTSAQQNHFQLVNLVSGLFLDWTRFQPVFQEGIRLPAWNIRESPVTLRDSVSMWTGFVGHNRSILGVQLLSGSPLIRTFSARHIRIFNILCSEICSPCYLFLSPALTGCLRQYTSPLTIRIFINDGLSGLSVSFRPRLVRYSQPNRS